MAYLFLNINDRTMLMSAFTVQDFAAQEGCLPSRDTALVKEPNTTDEESDDDSSDGDYPNSRPPAESILEAIVDTLDSIYRLSTRIRNTKTRLPKSKAHLLKRVDESTGVDLIARMKEVDSTHLEEVFWEYRASPSESTQDSVTFDTTPEDRDRLRRPKTLDPNDQILLSRLAQANTFRRQQFAHWRRHRDKNAKETAEALDQVKNLSIAKSKVFLGVKRPQQYGSKTQTTLSRPSTATQLLQDTILKVGNDDAKSAASTRTVLPRVFNAKDEDVQVPPPPAALQGATQNKNSFECPYCFIICPANMLQTGARRSEVSLKPIQMPSNAVLGSMFFEIFDHTFVPTQTALLEIKYTTAGVSGLLTNAGPTIESGSVLNILLKCSLPLHLSHNICGRLMVQLRSSLKSINLFPWAKPLLMISPGRVRSVSKPLEMLSSCATILPLICKG